MSDRPAAPPATRIYKSEHYNIYGRIFRNDGPVFVSFMFRNTSPQSFGEFVFLKYGLNAIHVLCRGPHWYQYPDTNAAGDAIRGFAKNFQRIVTYGTSMGGYAALLFSRPVGADLALSFSPQFSVDPKKVSFETRWLNDLAGIDKGGGFISDDMETNLTRTGQVIIAYDPLDNDRKHVELIRDIRPFDNLRIPFSKHRSLGVLAEMGLASRVLRQAAADNLDLAHLRRDIRSRRYESATYLRYIGREFEIRRKPHADTLLLKAAARTKPEDYEGIESNFRLLLRQNQEAAAAEQLLLLLSAPAFVGRPQSIKDVSRHAALLTSEGTIERAEAALMAHIQHDPAGSIAHHAAMMVAWIWNEAGSRDKSLGHLLNMIAHGGLPQLAFETATFLDAMGQAEPALAMAEMALKAFPARIDIAYFLSDRLEKRGDVAEALAVYEAFQTRNGLPDDPYRLRYARLLARLGREQEALEQCDTYLMNLPNHAVAHRVRGGFLAALSRHREACVSFENSLTFGGDNAATLQDLAVSLHETGRNAEAVATAKKAYQLDPRRVSLLRFIDEIEPAAVFEKL